MKEMSTIKFPNQAEVYEIVDATARLLVAEKSNIGHTHTVSEITDFAHEHDERYYTKTKIDEKIDEVSGSIQFDDTLSISGQAADAKAVGDALAAKQPIGNYATKDEIPTSISKLTNDSGFITVNGAPVRSVNGKTGAVTLNASDVGALSDTTVIPTVPTRVSAFTNDAGYLTEHQSLEGYVTEAYVDTLFTGKFVYSTIDLTANVSELAAGTIYFVYE